MSQDKLIEYQRELAHAMANLKNSLAEAQNTIGVAEAFLHLLQKESVAKK